MRLKFFRGLLFTFFLAIIVFGGLAFLADISKFAEALNRFNWLFLLPVLVLSLFNYLIRFVRWNYYLRKATIFIPLKDSAYTFFSGLLMSITPGKLGELLKSYILRITHRVPVSYSAPIVFAERLTDLIAVLVLTGIFFYTASFNPWALFLTFIIIIFFLALITSEKVSNFFISFLGKLRSGTRLVSIAENLLASLRELSGPAPLIIGTFLGLLAWLCECIGFYIVLKGMNIEHVGVSSSIFIYAFSTLVGALSMLPGGLVFTEGTMAGILISTGLNRSISLASTTIIRVATLWFGALLGLLVFASRKEILLQSIGLMEGANEKNRLSD